MFCMKCGQEVGAQDRFCQNCGANLATAPAPAEEAAPQPDVLMEQESNPQPQETMPEEVTPQPEVASQPEPAPTQTVTPEDPGAGTGKAAFVLGIIGLSLGTICSCGCSFIGGFIPLILSILAIVFGSQAKKKSAALGLNNQKAHVGMILGIIGVVVIVLFIILNAVLGAVLGAAGVYDSGIYDYYQFT